MLFSLGIKITSRSNSPTSGSLDRNGYSGTYGIRGWPDRIFLSLLSAPVLGLAPVGARQFSERVPANPWH